jgi:regulator of RNase E activity RraB
MDFGSDRTMGLVSGIKNLFLKKKRSNDKVDPENWQYFKRKSEDGFWLIMFDQNALSGRRQNYTNLVSITYNFRDGQLVNGLMPHPDLIEVYHSFEDRIEESTKDLGSKNIGNKVGFGIRKVWFIGNSSQLASRIVLFTKESAEFAIKVENAKWSEIVALKPSHLERQIQGNQNILNEIAKHGDNGAAAREVVHWIFNAPAETRMLLVQRLAAEGYKVEENSQEQVRFTNVMSLTTETADAQTTKLNLLCAEYDSVYDGWETPIVKQE